MSTVPFEFKQLTPFLSLRISFNILITKCIIETNQRKKVEMNCEQSFLLLLFSKLQ